MLQLAKPHSWWFDSNTGHSRSVWLQSTISELDEKIKAMLKLIEEDGDSFTQRAEMYYKRRPELVTMVGDFYRMHRSLAEGFDQLKSEARNRLIKRFCPPIQTRKLQKMEEPCDSHLGDNEESEVDDPEQDEHSHSYIGIEDEDYAESEVDDPEQEEKSNVGKEMEDEECNESEVDDPEQEENKTNVDGTKMGNEECEEFDVDYSEQENEIPVAMRKFSSIHRQGEVLKLQAEVEKLKEENRIQKEQLHGEYLGLIQEIEVAKLRGDMERLKEENMILKEQEFSCLILESEVAKLKDEIEELKEENRVQKVQLQGELSSLIHESEVAKLRDELMKLREENRIYKEQEESSYLIHEREVAKLRDEIVRLKVENVIHKDQQESSCLIRQSEVAKLRDEIVRLKEESNTRAKRELDQFHGLIYENEVAKLMDEIESVKKENLTCKEQSSGGESSRSIAPSEIAKLKDEMETLKKENMIQKEQLFQKDEEKRQVIRQLSLSLDIMRENLSLSKRSIENYSSKKRTPFEFSKFKELFSAKKLFSGNSKSHQTDQVLLQTLI